MPRKKPAPDIYVWAMERIGLAPGECVALEDSRHGVDAAAGAGIRAIVVTVNGYTAGQDFDGATLVLDSFGEPGAPAQRLCGTVPVEGFVGLDTLRAVHAASAG